MSFSRNLSRAWRRFMDRRAATPADMQAILDLSRIHDERRRRVALADHFARHEIIKSRTGLIYSVPNGAIHNVGR